ncbi:MAG: nicotinate-nucleotide adenylyltransferase [Edaphobacter sp.]|uniref:nicotinate-nucleotide adenylyltransferase n=1 Tax=Edaphobacter sp. TaxID=1934404 RepID=UPI0023899F95|nr:nicotinate-nucleotide adenylyltransferase [Edaphobacter sp.]MDE1176771.1 nicotinate-nucleotide adenylyltransferase [Edaphobacter sp.]
MRVALFGGTFDPPHLGHLGIARAAAESFALDTVLFAPVGQQPLKPGVTLTSFADRFAMVRLACEQEQKIPPGTSFTASTVDAPQPNGEPNYTVDTLARLRQEMPEAALYNLVGADSFLSLRKWREPERLLELAEWIVVSRPGYSLDDLSPLALTESERSRVHLIETVHHDVSSTWLRERLAAGDSARDLLPEGVARYIRQHNLYRGN